MEKLILGLYGFCEGVTNLLLSYLSIFTSIDYTLQYISQYK